MRRVEEDHWTSLQTKFESNDVVVLVSDDNRALTSALTALFGKTAQTAARQTLLLCCAPPECATLLREDVEPVGLCVAPFECLLGDLLPVKLANVTSLFVHRLDLEQPDIVVQALGRLDPGAKLVFTCSPRQAPRMKTMFSDRSVSVHTPACDHELAQIIKTKAPNVFLEMQDTDTIEKGAHVRFTEAAAVVNDILELRPDTSPDTADALRALFAQIPAALASAKSELAETLPQLGEDMTLLEWFVETFKVDDGSFVEQQLPVIVSAYHNTAQDVAEMNDRASDLLAEAGAEKHVFVEQVCLSEAVRARPGLWSVMSALHSQVLKLVVGMPVLLLHTLQRGRLEAGMVGRVLAFENGTKPIVCFYGEERSVFAMEPVVFKQTWGLSLGAKPNFRAVQFPLAPAFFLHDSLVRAIPLKSRACQWP